MATIKVESQAELDAALAKAKPGDIIAIVGSGSFELRGSAGAYGSASVTAYDSASVRAYDSASVTASGSASVTASGSASVTAYDSASVRAGKYVAVHTKARYGQPTIIGGVLIAVPEVKTQEQLLDYLGVTFEPPLGTVAKEAAGCRAAFAAVPDAAVALHMHHAERPFETLTEPIENRIAYIVWGKDKRERAIRLRLLRPAVGLPAGWETLSDGQLDALHDERCTNCTWNGHSILGDW